MKKLLIHRAVLLFLLAAFTSLHAQAEPVVQIGSGTVERGAAAEIPIYFNNEGEFTALQFDLTFDPAFFDEVDTSQCVYQLADGEYLADCRRQDWPNQDVIRFLAVSLTGEPIPSGELGYLVFQADQEAVSGVSPLSLLECTSLAVGRDQEEFVFTSEDYEPGEITVFGLEPPDKPVSSEIALNLDGEPQFSDNPLYRQKVLIPDPIPALAAGPGELVVTLPGGRQVEVASKNFIPRDGFVDRLACPGTQVPDNDAETALSFRWYGEVGENGWLGVTVVDDLLRGSFVTSEQSYEISGSPKEGYVLAELDPAELPPAHGNGLYRQMDKFAGSTFNRSLKIDTAEALMNAGGKSQSTGPVQLDLLIMYTAQAEIDAGGLAGLDALIQQAVDNTNQSFINSGYANLLIREVHRELLTGFVPVPLPPPGEIDVTDRDSLRLNAQIQAARDAHYADLTLVMLRNYFDNNGDQRLSYCGITYIQSPACGGLGDVSQCGVGVDFEDYAIALASVECANLPGRNTFPHEIGHMLGGEHPPGRGQSPANASFPWSYAHLRETGLNSLRFGTMMWVPDRIGPEVNQLLNFSNPDVLIVGGQSSGIVNQRDNIRTFEALAPTMELFRIPPPELIFADSFESP